MAIINCPECNKEISDKATACPNCGYPISGQKERKAFPSNYIEKAKNFLQNSRPSWILLFVFLLMIGLIIFIVNNSISDDKAELLTAAPQAGTQQLASQKVGTQQSSFQYAETQQVETQQAATQQVDTQNTATGLAIRQTDTFRMKTLGAIRTKEALVKTKEAYVSDYLSAVRGIFYETKECEKLTFTIGYVWQNAITYNNDVSLAIQSITDPNDNKFKRQAEIRLLINQKIVAFQSSPEKSPIQEDLLLRLYSDYDFLCAQSKDPTGSLFTYNQAIKEKTDDFYTTFNLLIISFPELQSCLDKELKNCPSFPGQYKGW